MNLRERIIVALGGVVPEKAGTYTTEATFIRAESTRAHDAPTRDDLDDGSPRLVVRRF